MHHLSAVFLLSFASALGYLTGSRPNILFFLVDDLGFGDVNFCHDSLSAEECQFVPPGNVAKQTSAHMRTPNLLKLTKEGMIFNNWYAPRSICTPSRAATLTARDPVRYSSVGQTLRIYPSNSARGGLPRSEKTTGAYMKELGYTTGYTGKWHNGLTDGKDPYYYSAWKYGFDEVGMYIAGSNGEPCSGCNLNIPGDPESYHMCTFSQLFQFSSSTQQAEIIEQPIRWENITSRILKASLDFIERQKDSTKPWFLQHNFAKAHVPWVPSRFFVSSKENGIWMDTIGEVDWAVGVAVKKLEELGMDKNTLIIFTADNGPYKEFASTYCPQNCKFDACDEVKNTAPAPDGGVSIPFGCELCTDWTEVSTAGPLKGGKGNIFEGGVREASFMWWPGKLAGGTIQNHITSSMDILPTIVGLAGGTLDTNRTLDGVSLIPYMEATPGPISAEPTGHFVYWCGVTLMAVRIGNYKVMWAQQAFTSGLNPNQNIVPEDRCDGGSCCDGGPGRLCTCDVGFVNDTHPWVYDLYNDQIEATNLNVGSPPAAITTAIAQAEAIRIARLMSVATDIKYTWNPLFSTMENNILFASLPNTMQVDACFTDGETPLPPNFPDTAKPLVCGLEANDSLTCPWVPPECQMPFAAPYRACGITINQQSYGCRLTRPCCQQEGYLGPFEYRNPSSSGAPVDCGCVKQEQGNTHFPEELLSSVCEWQKLNGVENQFCSPSICGTPQGLDCHDETMLKNQNLYNDPYPESQEFLRNPKTGPRRCFGDLAFTSFSCSNIDYVTCEDAVCDNFSSLDIKGFEVIKCRCTKRRGDALLPPSTGGAPCFMGYSGGEGMCQNAKAGKSLVVGLGSQVTQAGKAVCKAGTSFANCWGALCSEDASGVVTCECPQMQSADSKDQEVTLLTAGPLGDPCNSANGFHNGLPNPSSGEPFVYLNLPTVYDYKTSCTNASPCCSPDTSANAREWCSPNYDCVAGFDPYCASTAWDDQCVAEAIEYCSLSCV